MPDMALLQDDAGTTSEARGLARRFAAEVRTFPATVQDEMGYAIYLAQRGDKHVSAKPLKGLGFADRVFVLHAFQKKSKIGITTPTADIELIKLRLKQTIEIAKKKE